MAWTILSILTCRDTLAIALLGFFQCAIDLIPLISVVVVKAKSRPTAVAGSEGLSPARDCPLNFKDLALLIPIQVRVLRLTGQSDP
jgi:hypothetical protein